jgi:hypothetical protein
MQTQLNVMSTNLRRVDDFQRDVLGELHAMYDSYNAILAEVRAIREAMEARLTKIEAAR